MDPDQKMEETDSETGSRQRQQSERVTAIRKELSALDQSQMPIAYKLLKDELDYQLQEAGKRVSPPENPEYVRVDDKIVRLSQKIIVPVERDPEFNFVGKIVGKKGANMRQISSETNVRLSIKGKGSSKERDPEKEKELAESGKPEFEHLKEPLHVRIDCMGHPSKVWSNMQRALDMIAPLVLPDEKPSIRGDFANGGGREEGGRFNSGKFSGGRELAGRHYDGFEGSFGDRGFGDRRFGDHGYGDRGFGDHGYGDHGFRDNGFGDRGYGDNGYGDNGFEQSMLMKNMGQMRGREWSMNPMMRNYAGGMKGFVEEGGQGGSWGRGRGPPY